VGGRPIAVKIAVNSPHDEEAAEAAPPTEAAVPPTEAAAPPTDTAAAVTEAAPVAEAA
jgi:hypothetical protein